jgi:uncharacterized membrane protein YgdD (TMEM256/DUF423 family)
VQKTFLFLAAVLGALAVGLGAFGAHGLSSSIDEHSLMIYEKGITYQFYHVFALIACSMLYSKKPSKMIRWAYWMFFAGIICFSGSLYLLATDSLTHLPTSILGPITPLGGLLLLAGWVLLAVYSLRNFFGKRNMMGI